MKFEEYPLHDSVRGWFGRALYFEMKRNPQILLFTADLGFGLLDRIRDDMPDQFCNFGASEQGMIGAAVGATLSGKVVFCYSITTFLIFRSFEWLRNYLHYEEIPIILVGSGFGDDYEHDGITHQPFEVREVLNCLPNIKQFYPTQKEVIPSLVGMMISAQKPSFLCLRR